jgi:hypothetical protein
MSVRWAIRIMLLTLGAVGGASVALFVTFLLTPEPAMPLAVVGSNLVELGTLAPGEQRNVKFRVKNTSWRRPVKIKEVLQSCSCSVVQVEKKELTPQEVVDVELKFTGRSEIGPAQATVYLVVATDGKAINDAVTLTLTAVVAGREVPAGSD